jgi:hypothetical protein
MKKPPLSAIVVSLLFSSLCAAGDFAIKPGDSVLLLDDHTVVRTAGLEQRFFPASRHPAGPVLTRSQKWEGVGPYVWGTSLIQDPVSRLFRMWYVTYSYEGNMYRWGYATSRDALKWEKPDLGNGSQNLLPLGPHPEKGARAVARDPRPGTPPERRYLGVRFTYDGELVSFSPDGLKWTEYEKHPVWHVPSDILHVMFDDRRHKFVAYFKLWELSGTQVLESGEEKPFREVMPTFTPKEIPGKKQAKFEAPVVHLNPDSKATVTNETFVLRADKQGKDDGGGTSLSGAWTAKRVQAWAQSDDGIHWTNEQLILRADEKDPPTANIQYLFVIPHGGYYLGFATLHDERGKFQIHLCHSADGIKWTRTARTPWLDNGPPGSFDSNMVLGPSAPIFWEREMWFMYGGFPIPHDTADQNWESKIGIATMRLDGFVSWDAKESGELVTQPFRLAGDRLFVNCDARASGNVRVDVLDEHGKVVPGYEAGNCKPLAGDTLAKGSDGWVHWANNPDLKNLLNKTIQLRFVVKDAQLFAFRIADDATANLPVPRATDK